MTSRFEIRFRLPLSVTTTRLFSSCSTGKSGAFAGQLQRNPGRRRKSRLRLGDGGGAIGRTSPPQSQTVRLFQDRAKHWREVAG